MIFCILLKRYSDHSCTVIVQCCIICLLSSITYTQSSIGKGAMCPKGPANDHQRAFQKLHVNFKIFSDISILNWFFAQMRKDLSLGFLLSFKFIKSFQNSIKIALIFIKISFFKSKFATISWKFSKFCSFPLLFRLLFRIFVSFEGLRPLFLQSKKNPPPGCIDPSHPRNPV